MGIKSTQDVDRGYAERSWVRMRLERKTAKWEAELKAQASLMTDTELENKLEEENDRAHGGEGFENYIIIQD